MKSIYRLLGALLLFALIGCGGSGDKGKNKDKDVPRAVDPAGK